MKTFHILNLVKIVLLITLFFFCVLACKHEFEYDKTTPTIKTYNPRTKLITIIGKTYKAVSDYSDSSSIITSVISKYENDSIDNIMDSLLALYQINSSQNGNPFALALFYDSYVNGAINGMPKGLLVYYNYSGQNYALFYKNSSNSLVNNSIL